jgi:hypothetical protein
MVGKLDAAAVYVNIHRTIEAWQTRPGGDFPPRP